MPDITMCVNGSCPKSIDCYRHADSGTVSDGRWQSYAYFSDDDEDCYWPITRSEP